MSYELKNGEVVIFKNTNPKSEKAPAYTGKAMMDGIELEISLWVKEGKQNKFFSGRIGQKMKKAEDKTSVNRPELPEPDDLQSQTDDLPF